MRTGKREGRVESYIFRAHRSLPNPQSQGNLTPDGLFVIVEGKERVGKLNPQIALAMVSSTLQVFPLQLGCEHLRIICLPEGTVQASQVPRAQYISVDFKKIVLKF